MVLAKATEDTRESGAGVEEPSRASREVERPDALSRELERPSLALVKAETRSEPIYNRYSREVIGGQEGVGGGNSSDDGWDNITHPEQRTPTSSTHDVKERNAHEC